VSKRSGFYPCLVVDGAGTQVVSQAGAVLLTDVHRPGADAADRLDNNAFVLEQAIEHALGEGAVRTIP
jgi:hypothetical protein